MWCTLNCGYRNCCEILLQLCLLITIQTFVNRSNVFHNPPPPKKKKKKKKIISNATEGYLAVLLKICVYGIIMTNNMLTAQTD